MAIVSALQAFEWGSAGASPYRLFGVRGPDRAFQAAFDGADGSELSEAFGEGGDLYITTASRDVTEATRSRQPDAGGLFKVQLPVSGVRSTMFAG